jgi:hypothetical protein
MSTQQPLPSFLERLVTVERKATSAPRIGTLIAVFTTVYLVKRYTRMGLYEAETKRVRIRKQREGNFILNTMQYYKESQHSILPPEPTCIDIERWSHKHTNTLTEDRKRVYDLFKLNNNI